MKCTCKKCEYEWIARVESRLPVQCPRCKRMDWNIPKETKEEVIKK